MRSVKNASCRCRAELLVNCVVQKVLDGKDLRVSAQFKVNFAMLNQIYSGYNFKKPNHFMGSTRPHLLLVITSVQRDTVPTQTARISAPVPAQCAFISAHGSGQVAGKIMCIKEATRLGGRLDIPINTKTTYSLGRVR